VHIVLFKKELPYQRWRAKKFHIFPVFTKCESIRKNEKNKIKIELVLIFLTAFFINRKQNKISVWSKKGGRKNNL
jgi:hypothetical protein